MKRKLMVIVVLGAFLSVATAAFAHHSFAATYLEDQKVTIKG